MKKILISAENNSKAISVINEIARILYIQSVESDALDQAKKKASFNLEETKKNLEIDEAGNPVPNPPIDKKIIEFTNELNAIRDKKSGLNAWTKKQLFGWREGQGRTATRHVGLYQSLLGADLYSKYESAFTKGEYGPFNAYIKEETLVKRFGFDNLPASLLNKLARNLEHAVGLKTAKNKEKMQGIYVTLYKENAFYETFYGCLVKGLKDVSGALVVPDTDKFTVKVEYNQDLSVKEAWMLPTKVYADLLSASEEKESKSAKKADK